MPDSSFPVFFSSRLCSPDGKPLAKLAGLEVDTGHTPHTPPPQPRCGVPGGLSLQSRLFPARRRACSCLTLALAPEQERLGEGSGTGSRGIKADIVGMSSRCSERICRRLAEAAGGTLPWKGLFVPAR